MKMYFGCGFYISLYKFLPHPHHTLCFSTMFFYTIICEINRIKKIAASSNEGVRLCCRAAGLKLLAVQKESKNVANYSTEMLAHFLFCGFATIFD